MNKTGEFFIKGAIITALGVGAYYGGKWTINKLGPNYESVSKTDEYELKIAEDTRKCIITFEYNGNDITAKFNDTENYATIGANNIERRRIENIDYDRSDLTKIKIEKKGFFNNEKYTGKHPIGKDRLDDYSPRIEKWVNKALENYRRSRQK